MLFFPHGSSNKIACSCVGISTSSNTSLISIAISNGSESTISYFVGSPALKSNGAWEVSHPIHGTQVLHLGAGQSTMATVTASSGTGEARVPVFWGFTYSPNAVEAYLRSHGVLEARSTHRIPLHTNFVTGIKL
jgi:hypothetical protein